MVDNLTFFTRCGGLLIELSISNHLLIVLPERILQAETGWAKGILKSAIHGGSGVAGRHCEKEGDEEHREG